MILFYVLLNLHLYNIPGETIVLQRRDANQQGDCRPFANKLSVKYKTTYTWVITGPDVPMANV